MSRPIGYYVHHHGDGHRQRAIAIGQSLGGITLLGTGLTGKTGNLPFLDLPDDRLNEGFAGIDHAERPSSLHYAPLDHEGIRQRTAMMALWIAQSRPSLMVVDVSAEVAMLARLASVPTIYVRLSGTRLDTAHLDAFRGATALLAPFHEALDDDDIPTWVREKTFYAPGIIRPASISQNGRDGDILIVLGRGGGISDGERLAEVARSTPERQFRIIGPCTVPSSLPDNLELRGWVDDADAQIAAAAVVIGAAGDGVVSAVLAARRPFICLPEHRPFNEQVSKARRLAAVGGAIVRFDWPQASDWTGLIDLAINQAEHWPVCLTDEGGAEAAARWLHDLTAAPSSHRSRTA
ncbi:glycosyltransferase [Sphingobium yanoikuyae]|uniref:glycosyltransferase n=1 Tax=Sphingobium yanoikuyae TaxID=13690 RepID=UPI000F7ED2F1|nr:glycosyltransferase [Sphingobium yanoikuyae]MDG2515605.1 glycosyltransferase [Sphingobium yanoikuyae]RSU69731.1 glycosyltransferase [Sphingomonas sp. S-NIH.Pt3_0716]